MTTKDKLVLILALGFVVCLGLAVIYAIVSSNLEEKRLADMPVIPVTFDTIASHKGEKVSIEGEVLLGLGVPEVENCGCELCEYPEELSSCYRLTLTSLNYDPTLPFVEFDLLGTTLQKKQPNHFYLPYFFEAGDFRIYTNNGQELTEEDPIRVVGFVCKVLDEGETFEAGGIEHSSTEVYMCVIRIEAVK